MWGVQECDEQNEGALRTYLIADGLALGGQAIEAAPVPLQVSAAGFDAVKGLATAGPRAAEELAGGAVAVASRTPAATTA